jgi:hypothetical protein
MHAPNRIALPTMLLMLFPPIKLFGDPQILVARVAWPMTARHKDSGLALHPWLHGVAGESLGG